MAVKFRFTKDFDYRAEPRIEVAYKKGMELLVPDAHAKAAEEAGAGERAAEAAPEQAADAKRK